jgi:hypothetical protein
MAVDGFLSGGLPLGRLDLSIAPIMWLQIILDKWATGVFNVATLNQEAQMTKYNPNLDVEVRIDSKGRTVYECKTEATARKLAAEHGGSLFERGLNRWEVTCK